MLGIAIGVTAVDAGDVAQAATTTGESLAADADTGGISTAAGVWWIVTGTIAIFIGGLITGRLLPMPRSAETSLHGFTLWAVTAVFGFAVLWSGAGMAANAAAYPMAYYGASQDRAYASTTQANNAGTANRPVQTAEQAQDAAQTASWWSVIALLLGIAAAVIGTLATAPSRDALNRRAAAPAM